jgi:hypothetical protein
MTQDFTLQSNNKKSFLEQDILKAKIFKIHYKVRNAFHNKSETISNVKSR